MSNWKGIGQTPNNCRLNLMVNINCDVDLWRLMVRRTKRKKVLNECIGQKGLNMVTLT
jgi:hypothetical protein